MPYVGYHRVVVRKNEDGWLHLLGTIRTINWKIIQQEMGLYQGTFGS